MCGCFCAQAQQHLDQFYRSDLAPPELNATGAERIEALLLEHGDAQRHDLGYSKRRYREFVFKYNYFSERLNKSGEVFFGDTISQYLNELKDFLLEGDSLKDRVTVYFTQNPSVNAFTNDFGSIYFNVGLLCKLKSEVELLTVLAHEITHIRNQHTHQFEAYQKEKNWDKDEISNVLSKHRFSRQQEYEADYGSLALLAKRGVPLKSTLPIFEVLQFDANPVHFGTPDLKLLAGNHTHTGNYWQKMYADCDSLFLGFDSLPEPPDSLQTHPLPKQRLDSATVLIEQMGETNEAYQPQGDFAFFHQLAQEVLLRSYLERGWLQSGLHLTLKLRENNPQDTFLVKTQARFLTLVAQDKYNGSPWDQVLNHSGRNISDHGFLHYREIYRTPNALEFNLLALLAVKQLQQDFSITYLDRVDRFLTLFLYKNNASLFSPTATGIGFVTADSLTAESYRVNLLDTGLNFTTEQREVYREVVEENQGIIVPIHTGEEALDLLRYYVKQHPWTSKDSAFVADYRAHRDQFEAGLTIDEFSASINPNIALKAYRKGVFVKSEQFDANRSVSLIGMRHYHFVQPFFSTYRLHYRKALELETPVKTAITKHFPVAHNYSNTNITKLTVNSIYQHRLLKTWTNERYQLNDLIYSRVDEEVQLLRLQQGLEYLALSVNSSNTHRKYLAPKNTCISILTLYDLESESIVYVAKNSSALGPKSGVFNQLFYLRTVLDD